GGRALALGLELRQREPYDPAGWAPRRVEAADPRTLSRHRGGLTLGMRPLVRSDSTGAWIKGDVSWDVVRRPGAPFHRDHALWFAELAGIALGARSLGPYADPGEWIALDTVTSSLLWPHLRTAAAVGVEVVATAKNQSIAFADEASAAIRVEGAGEGDLRLTADVSIGGDVPQDLIR